MKTNYQISWEQFISGKWTKDIPIKDGVYPLCDIDERYSPVCPCQTIEVIHINGRPSYRRNNSARLTHDINWSGYFWNRPFPFLIQGI
jgi:hypothetical protein